MEPDQTLEELAHVAWKKLRRIPLGAVAILEAPYDANYLWLSRTLKLPLVTRDRELARAARR